MVKISHFKIAMGFFGKIWENISISLPRTIPVVASVVIGQLFWGSVFSETARRVMYFSTNFFSFYAY